MIRLALIGCSDGAAYYARLAARLHGAQFTAVVDRDTQAAEKTARALDAAVWSDSFETLLANYSSTFDAVVCFDTQICQVGATAGKHTLLVGQAFRFLPSVQTVKECLDSGKLGEPGLVRLHHWQPLDSRNQLTEALDLACWLFGERPSVVYAAGRVNYMQLHLGFERGGMALIDLTQTLPPSPLPLSPSGGEGLGVRGNIYFSLSLIGSAGAAYADDHHNTQLLFGQKGPTALNTDQGDGHILAQLQEFINAIAENREPLITAADAQRTDPIAEAVAKSITTGQALRWTGKQYELVEP